MKPFIIENCTIYVKVIGQTKFFISKEEKSIKPSIFLQSEAKTLQELLLGFAKIVVGEFQKKAVTFKVNKIEP